jgi:uncharacterized membrane protein
LGDKTDESDALSQETRAHHSRAALLAGPEGRILLLGVTLTAAHLLWLGTEFLLEGEQSQILMATTATAAVFGRAAGLAFGYTMGLGHRTVIPICMIVETVMVLLFYPLFVFSWRHLLVIKRLKNVFDRIHSAAETHKDKVQKYGLIGLFAFVWFPFWMTGPVVGCVIGFLLGLRAWVNMVVVLAGTYVAIFVWALFLRQIHQRVAAYSSRAALVALVVLIVGVFLCHFLHRIRQTNRDRS